MAQKNDKRIIFEEIKRYVAELRKRNIDIVAAYLFGSYATGKYTKWSDIDVALLTTKFVGDSFDFKFLLMKIARDINYNIESHPYLVNEFNKDNPMAEVIMKTGKRIV